MEKMNLFEKLQNVRIELANSNLKMTGKNSFAKYEYFELADFTKTLNELMLKYRMTAIPSFTSETASLTAINFDNTEERFTITSPFSKADLKGCHDVQMVGAVETYQRRYLYQAMFDIAENDSLNATQGQPVKKVEKPKNELPFPEQGVNVKTPSVAEIKAQRQVELMKLGAEYYTELVSTQWQAVLTQVSKLEGKKFSEMTDEEYARICENIKNRKY